MKIETVLLAASLCVSVHSSAFGDEACAETFRTTLSGCQLLQGIRSANGAPFYLGTAFDGPINDRAMALVPVRWMLDLIKNQSSPPLASDEEAAKILFYAANSAADSHMAKPKVEDPKKQVIDLILSLARKDLALCELGRELGDIYAYDEVSVRNGTFPDGCFGLKP